MSRSLLHDWEYNIERCCRENDPTEMKSIAEDIYNTAYARGKNQSIDVEEVLDKIKTEIEAKCCITVGRENDGAITLHDVFEIIDKYKGERTDNAEV